jgi:HAD superfamily hydrolase (TIGR01509 family)
VVPVDFPPPRAVIFDLDGTLTEPLLDFDAIRAEIGLPPGLPILEQMAAGDDALRARGEAVLRRHELAAMAHATLSDGCRDLLALLAARGVPAAILTRNTRDSVECFARTFGFHFAAVWTREDGPPKPSPAGVLHLCRAIGEPPARALVVGDYRFDIMAGRDAGCRTALLARNGLADEDRAAWGSPDLVVRSLAALLPLWPPR